MKFPSISKITVLLRNGHTDLILIELESDTPFPEMKYPAKATVEARSGYGEEWVYRTFGEAARDHTEIVRAF